MLGGNCQSILSGYSFLTQSTEEPSIGVLRHQIKPLEWMIGHDNAGRSHGIHRFIHDFYICQSVTGHHGNVKNCSHLLLLQVVTTSNPESQRRQIVCQ